jgi:sugar phosphate isomerase/epimerase
VGAWTCYRKKENDRIFNEFAEFIGACGGGVVVRGSQYEGTHPSRLEGSIQGFYEHIADQIELARKHKCRIAIENHAHAILDSPQSFELFTKHNPAPEVVGFSIAPYHLQRRKADVAQVIRDHGDKLLFFYAWQLAEGTKQLPGHGPVDFSAWLRALRGVGYSHWMTPFMHGELPADEMAEAVSKSFEYLNQLKTS